MKIKYFAALACGVLTLTGCASNRGGTGEDTYDTLRGTEYEQGEASPTFRPGMNREDPRDAQFSNRPQADHGTSPTVP